MGKDVTFQRNTTGGSTTVSGKDYVRSIINQVLYTKGNDPFSIRGVNLSSIKYKPQEEWSAYRDKIRHDIDEYTDIRCVEVNFLNVENTLYIALLVEYQDRTYSLGVDTNKESVEILSV